MTADEKRELYDRACELQTEIIDAQNLVQTQHAMVRAMYLIIEIIEEIGVENDNK